MDDLAPEPPDAFLVDAHARHRRALRRNLAIALGTTVVAVAGCATWAALGPGLGPVELIATAVILVVAAAVNHVVPPLDPPRRRPDTPVEVGMVIGCEVVEWGAGRGPHVVRVLITPCDTPWTLLHGGVEAPSDDPLDPAIGTVVAFRRHPSTRHLVWMEGDAPTPEAIAAATGAARAPDGDRATARVVAPTVGDPSDDGRWRVDVELSLGGGAPGRATCLLPPEHLGLVAPGTELAVSFRPSPDGADCVILFPGAEARPAP